MYFTPWIWNVKIIMLGICTELFWMSSDLTNLASQMPVKINKTLKKNDISHNYLFCSRFGR